MPSIYFTLFLIVCLYHDLAHSDPCTDGKSFFLPSLNGSTNAPTCVPVPVNAAPSSNGLAWSCVDGTVGTYGLRKYNLPCSSYSFSSTLGNAATCTPYASAGLSEGYSTYGWCVSCQIDGNCPGAWAQVDLGLVGSVAGVYVSGRSGFCNFPLTVSAKTSVDGVTWTDVDGGFVFPTGMTIDHRCSYATDTYMIDKPLATIRFAAPLMARYLRVYPLTRSGFPVWNTYGAYPPWWMCMQFEPLAVSPASSNLVVMYPFSNAATIAQGYGYLPTVLTGPFTESSWTSFLGGGLMLGIGQVAYSPYIDFSEFSEFTLSYWTSAETYSCGASSISFGLVDESGKIFYGVAPCYGTSFMKVTFDGTKTFNCFGCGQDVYRKNRQTLHGRRSGNGTTNYFWFGQGGGVYASNGMSGAYEIFNLPKWPGKLRFSFGSPGHKHIIKMHDVRLYRDASMTGSDPGRTGSVPMDALPTPRYVPNMDSCAICQPGFYCANNQVFACPPNSSAGYHATSISQCVCSLGLFKDPVLGCRLCKAGFYCPNENTEVACSIGCSNSQGVLYQSANCSSFADRVCTACPSTSSAANTMGVVPSACICPANSYNNGSGAGCSVCPPNAISPSHSYGLSSCACVSGFFNSPTIDNATGKLLALDCTLCPAGTYSLANTQVCFPYPNNTVASAKSPLGFFCPNGYFMPTDVPVMINASTGYPTRPGMIFWNFESTSFSVMKNEWGNYTPANGALYNPPRIFPDSTTTDIMALNPNVQCKFGRRCALIGGTISSIYKYSFDIPSFTRPATGFSVSFWFRVNSCVSCNLGDPVRGYEFFNFAGVSARHIADTNYRLALSFTYNGLSINGWDVWGTGASDTSMSAFKDKWHHHLFTFLPGGNFSGYMDGVFKVNKIYNLDFPSTISGSFFTSNYYNGMVDDFAIFEGDVAPYLSNLQTKPANQALDGTGIAAACVPCFIGMYCNNNTANTCPNNKTNSLPVSSWETDCQCNDPGKSGSGNFTSCTTLCPVNNYCLGSGYPTQNCPENQLSSTNASLLSHCTCPAIYQLDAKGVCGCPSPLSTASKEGGCTCNPGYIASPTGSYDTTVQHPGLNLCGAVNNKYCNHTTLGDIYYRYDWYPYQYDTYPHYMFDDDSLCTDMVLVNYPKSNGQNAATLLMIDLQAIYFIKNMSFLGSCWETSTGFWLGISSSTDLTSIKYVYTSPNTIPLVPYKLSSTNIYVVDNPTYNQVPDINTHARYIYIKSFGAVNSLMRLTNFRLLAFKPSCSACDAGYFCPTNSSLDKQICPGGYYCPPASSAPIPCGYNKYSLPGASQCSPCPSYLGITDTTTASSPTQCRCPSGYGGNASLSLIPISPYAVKVGPGIISWEPWRKINGKLNTNFYTPGSWVSDQFPSFGSTCDTPSYVQYDLQAVYPLSQIFATPMYGTGTPCGLYLKVSLTGEFTGEETTVFQCPLSSSCPPYKIVNTITGYVANFPTQYARYVRFYLAGDSGDNPPFRNFITNFYVYQCVGPECSACAACPKNFYCPGTVQQPLSVPCPNSTYTYADGAVGLIVKGPTSVAECSCPSNAGIQSGNTFCTCNAGYYYQQNTSDALQHVGWQCVPCPYNTTSLPGALNYSDCFCSGGFQSISLNPSTVVLPDTVITRFTEQPSSNIVITISNPEYIFKGDIRLLNDGVVGKMNNGRYPELSAITWTKWVTPPVWVQYDLKGIYPLTKIIARYNGLDSTAFSSVSFKISKTGFFSGEEEVVFSCGLTINVWCPAPNPAAIGYSASFAVKYARYVRWYTGATDGIPAYPWLMQLSVFYATKAYNCSNCASNSYCPSTVINQTFKCPNNTFSFPGAAGVSQCVCPTNAALQTGATNCSCNAGYYLVSNTTAPLNAGWQCNACPPNLLSPVSSTSITQCICVAGYYPTNPIVSLQVCSICPVNTYCPFKIISPVPCPAGTTSNNLTGTASTCTTPCPPGFYCPGDTQILPCPSGTYSTGGAKSACTTCEPGYFCNTTLVHVTCPKGFYCPSGSIAPVPCTSGTYSLGGASVCTTCEVGYSCPTVFGHVQCPILTYCPPGSTAPLLCEPGLYSCAGSGLCTIQCPPGGYCPGNGTVIACPLGSFSNGGASASGCTPCPEGFFCDFSLQLTAAGCV